MNLARNLRFLIVRLLACLMPVVGTSCVDAQAPDVQAPDTVGKADCALNSGVAALLERCAAGAETSSACTLARVAHALVAADEGAALKILQQEMGFDAGGASELLPTFRLLTLFSVGTFEPMSPCAARASQSLMKAMEAAIAGLPMDA